MISLDVQFLPDVDIPCPECRGSRYGKQAKLIRYTNKDGEERSLPELMNMDVNTAVHYCRHMKSVRPKLEILRDLSGTWLSYTWRGNTIALWRRSTAFEAGK